jgi:signal transduction histidine kinase
VSTRLAAAIGGRFRSLHARVLAAFVAVILLTLASAGSAAVWLVQGYRTRLEVDHLSDLAFAASITARQLDRLDPRPEEVAALIAGQLSNTRARALVLDSQGRVLAERPQPSSAVDGTFAGRTIEIPDPPPVRVTRGLPPPRPVAVANTTVGGRPFILISGGAQTVVVDNRTDGGSSGGSTERLDRFFARPPTYRVVLVVPERNIASAWRELAPRLGWAALIGVVASVAAASWLSDSITRRLRQITHAAEEIARGELRQEIPAGGGDEVAQLAKSFNIMSREVERSHRALRDFLANASHELRTPLTSIQGFSQALLDDALPGPDGATEAGRIINEEAERMRRLVEDLLYLSRVETREAPVARGPVDVAALIGECARRLRLTCDRRGLQLVLTLPDHLTVVGVADEIDHLFGNLLENAGKYTPEGGTITVAGSAAQGAVRVAVHNTGSFIPEEDLPHVFERFFRVDRSRAREVEGSGLGLAIASQVAERHGGSIRVASSREAGTTFEVLLPAGGAPGERGERDERGQRGHPAERAADAPRATPAPTTILA